MRDPAVVDRLAVAVKEGEAAGFFEALEAEVHGWAAPPQSSRSPNSGVETSDKEGEGGIERVGQ